MENLKLAIPNKGALSEGAVKLLTEAGYNCRRSGRELIVADNSNGIDFVFLRPRDIALYVGRGIIDLGITGRDLAADSGAEVTELLPLGFGKSRFCFAAPAVEKLQSAKALDGKRIATSYPQLLKGILDKLGLSCPIVKLDGAVEISIRLGVADAIADVVESGTTLREAGLAILGDPLMFSEALLVGGTEKLAENPDVKKLIGRLLGIIRASEYAMVEYNIPRDRLEVACRITPGVEAPTVLPLTNPEWLAVKAMIRRKECNRIMDELYEAGARGIFVADVRSCRI